VRVREVATREDARKWEDYILRTDTAVLYHDLRWRDYLKRVYGLKTLYLLAENHGPTVGVLPVVLVKGLSGGLQAVSSPYHMYGGVCADTPEAEGALLADAEERLRPLGADPWELRQVAPLSVNYGHRSDKITVILDLPNDPDQLWGSLSAKVRNQIRKGEKSGLTATVGGERAMEDFFDVMAVNMRDLGSPIHSFAFFKGAEELFPGETRVHRVFHDKRCIAAGVTILWKGKIELPWASALREYSALCGNMFLYWNMIKDSIMRGATAFDFGRCNEGSGTHRFKTQWGGSEKRLHYYYWRKSGNHDIPSLHSGRGFQIASGVWKRLPVPLTRILGPRIVRTIP
jgi:FemAB-related protein (PEP-CTERM system-associated)